MVAFVDHYRVLGLPSGEEGAKLTEEEITKAYRKKAREVHPDKKPGDQNAASNFQQLGTSYDILRDDKARNLFDDQLRDKRDKERQRRQSQRDNELRQSQRDGKRRKMVSDLERREREAFAAAKEREREDRISGELKEQISRILAMHAKKVVPDFDTKKESASSRRRGGGGGGGVVVHSILFVFE